MNAPDATGDAAFAARLADIERMEREWIVTVAAAARNWHGAVLGQNDMRPGIAPPREIEGRV